MCRGVCYLDCWRDNPVETLAMFRTPIIAALAATLLGGTALAQPANGPPADLSSSARSAPDYDEDASARNAPDYDEDAPPPLPPRGYAQTPPPAPPPAAYDNAQRNSGPPPQAAQNDRNMADRDIF